MPRPLVAGFAAVFVALAVIHAPLVRQDPLLERDDKRLIDPLAQVTSLAGYVDAVRAGRIVDLQPVRDLSFAADLALRSATGVGTFHLTNLLLWFAIVALVHALLRAMYGPSLLLFGAVALFALHPVFVNSVAWVSARKHLLAALFILAATVWLVRATAPRLSGRSLAGIVALYALSLASQPIMLLWPLWAGAYLWLGQRRALAIRLGALCLPFLVACAAANLVYYRGLYVELSGAEKFIDTDGTAGVAALALGRSFANLVFPAALATQYYPGSALNLAGLFAAFFGIGATLRWRPRAQGLLWLGLFLFPLAIVTVRMTAIFVSDTYLIVPGVGLLGLAALWLPSPARPKISAAVAAALAVAVLGAFALSYRQARTWRSDAALWAHAAEVEPTPNALAKHAYFLSTGGATREAIELARRLGIWDPAHREYPLVFARAVFLDRQYSVDEKLSLITGQHLAGPWPHYFLGALLAGRGQFIEAHPHLVQAIADPEALKADLAAVAAELFVVCGRAGQPGCAVEVHALRNHRHWNEHAFALRVSALQGTQADVFRQLPGGAGKGGPFNDLESLENRP